MEHPIDNEVETQKPAVYAVDDDSCVRRSYLRMLLGMDLPAKVLVFESAIDLLKEIEEGGEVPILVISDYQMPEMNGDVLCEKLRAMTVNGKPPVVIVVTGSYCESLKRQLIEAGAESVYAKPLNTDAIAEIKTRIKEVLADL